jgi:hypothetical protein
MGEKGVGERERAPSQSLDDHHISSHLQIQKPDFFNLVRSSILKELIHSKMKIL